jgi:hypothetical protein
LQGKKGTVLIYVVEHFSRFEITIHIVEILLVIKSDVFASYLGGRESLQVHSGRSIQVSDRGVSFGLERDLILKAHEPNLVLKVESVPIDILHHFLLAELQPNR